jgi:hypothetical protein
MLAMAGTKIQAAERPIGDVFSDLYRFVIPRYQRPYAWTNDQAGEMLEDLLEAARCRHRLEDSDPYFLGSVVLVKGEGDALAEVVDGQQRLTTLMILLSVIRDYVPEAYAASLGKRIFQQGDPIKGTRDQPRLTLKDRDQPFLEKQILDRDGVTEVASAATAALTDSQRNLAANAVLFSQRLAKLPEEDCTRLVTFVDQYTFLVIVATQDFESAYRIFTVLNERGLDLTHTDILKSEIIGEIPKAAQDAYTATWEQEEEDLGRADFADLFSHIRMVFAKSKARESILKEFRTAVLSRFPNRRDIINHVLVPLSNAFEAVTRKDFKCGTDVEDEVNQLFQWLNQLDNTDWIPPAISYLSRHGGDPDAVLVFVTDLERLAASMHIRRVDITRRIERYGRVLGEIEHDLDLTAPDSPLQLTDNERTETLRLLDGDIYSVTRIRLYVLERLDCVLSSGGASYDHPLITVEHVLPQRPKAGSLWRTGFTDEQHAVWVNRLANLVLLTRRKNSEAGTADFDVKKGRYFTGSAGVSPFVLTTQVLREPTWTPDVLKRRQHSLLSKLADLWRL